MLGYDPDTDRHRYRAAPHYRPYLAPKDNKPCIIQLQDHDYYDYDPDRFIGPEAYDTEAEARAALQQLLIDAAKILGVLPDFLHLAKD